MLDYIMGYYRFLYMSNIKNNTTEGETMTKINDPFGFNKAINFKVLDDPKVLNEVAKMFDIEPITINAQDIIDGKKKELEKIIPNNNYNPNQSYKKAVNSLKKRIK